MVTRLQRVYKQLYRVQVSLRAYRLCLNTCCRWATLIILLLFAWRWWHQGGAPVAPPGPPSSGSRCSHVLNINQIVLGLNYYGATFILEVCGGAGAMWGCAEVRLLYSALIDRLSLKCDIQVAGTSGHSLRSGWGDPGSFVLTRFCLNP